MPSEKRNDWSKYPTRHHRPKPSLAWRKNAIRLMRDRPRCHVCNGHATEVDHVKPVCFGGTDDLANAAPICRRCHLTKTAREANHMRWHVHRSNKSESDQ